jgi:GntR family transcriptional regulator
MYADDVPVQLATSYLPMDVAAGTQLVEVDTGPGGTYSRLVDLGHAPVEFSGSVQVRPPHDEVAQFLRMEAEQRVYAIRRLARTAVERVVEVNDIMPAHQWELVYGWSAQ